VIYFDVSILESLLDNNEVSIIIFALGGLIMTLKEFKHDMLRGLGTCFIEMNNSTEIDKYKPIVLFGCLNVLSYEHQMEGTRSGYIYDLTQYFHDDPYFENAIIDKFNKNPRGTTRIITLIERLAQFAMNGSQRSKNTLYAKYDKLIHKKNISSDDGIILDYLCVNLLDVSGYRFFKYHVNIMEQFNTNIDDTQLGWFYFKVQQKYKNKGIELLKTIHPEYGNNSKSTYKQKDNSFKDILNHLTDADFYLRRIAFSYRADESEIRKAIDFLIDDTDLNRKQRLFSLLRNDIIDYRIDDVIEMIGKYSPEIDMQIYKYCSNLVKSPVSKKIGYSILDKPFLRSFGLQMIIRNYESADLDTVVEYTKKVKVDYEDSEEWYSLFSRLLVLMDSKSKNHPVSLLKYIFFETLSSYHREQAFDIMKKRRLLAKQFIEIACFDSDWNIVEKANKELSKTIFPINRY